MFVCFFVFCLLCCTDGQVSVLVVGLGGGGLPQFIRDFVPSVQVEVVELDPAVQEVAKTWFGFQTDDRLKVIVGDGLEHISTLESEGKFLKCFFFFNIVILLMQFIAIIILVTFLNVFRNKVIKCLNIYHLQYYVTEMAQSGGKNFTDNNLFIRISFNDSTFILKILMCM